jgi:imidazolonepropionase-like amidohydrolase
MFSFALCEARPKNTVIALVGGTVIDGTGSPAQKNTVIVINKDRIQAIGTKGKVNIPDGAEIIDVFGKWILPGFIDCHIHLTYPFTKAELKKDTESMETIRALYIMEKYLKSGVTTVRDVGSTNKPMQALIAAARSGYTDTIRLFSTGQVIIVPGGHGDGLRAVKKVKGPRGFQKAVRDMFNAGFRYIKIAPPFTLEEVKAAVDEARTLGIPIAAHGGGRFDTIPTTMTRIAVEGGVDCIEHLNEMEEDVLDLMAEKGVFNVPTMAIYRQSYNDNSVPKVLTEERGWTIAMHEELFKKARAKKITMGIGTDSVGPYMRRYPKIYFTEMKYFVELGVTPMQTIMAATKIGAMILGKENELGTIEPGKLADIQVINGDPLKSFDALGYPEIVMIGGKIYKFK